MRGAEAFRPDPGEAPGLNPRKVGVVVVLAVAVLLTFLYLPLQDWVPGGVGSWLRPSGPPAPQGPTAVSRPGAQDAGLSRAYLPKVPAAPPVADATPAPDTSMMDALQAQYADLRRQYDALVATLQATPKEIAAPVVQKTTQALDTRQAEALKRKEEARKAREEYGKSAPQFRTGTTEKKPGQTMALKSPFSLAPGEVIPCQTTMATTSDIPGAHLAVIAQDIYDTHTKRRKVIPKDSRIVLQPGGTIFGDRRVVQTAATLTLPGGHWLKFPKVTVTDASGRAGFSGRIDRHFWQNFTGSILLGGLSGGTSMVTSAGGSGTAQVGNSMLQSTGAQGQQMVRQYMQTKPTIETPKDWGCLIILEDELVLSRSYP